MKFIPTVYETNPMLNNHIPALHKQKNSKMLASVHNKLKYSDIIRLLVTNTNVIDDNLKTLMEYPWTKNFGCSKY
jgi:hypothetical protein